MSDEDKKPELEEPKRSLSSTQGGPPPKPDVGDTTGQPVDLLSVTYRTSQ